MHNDISNAVMTCNSAELPIFEKRIGSTTYRVAIHFSQTSTETVEDKLLRLMENEVRDSA